MFFFQEKDCILHNLIGAVWWPDPEAKEDQSLITVLLAALLPSPWRFVPAAAPRAIAFFY